MTAAPAGRPRTHDAPRWRTPERRRRATSDVELCITRGYSSETFTSGAQNYAPAPVVGCITRGYSSETFTHSIAETVRHNTSVGKTTFIYQLGDHDPSGVDAWRSFGERVRGFAPAASVEFERIAVTAEQLILLHLPTRPTKGTDSRSASFEGESVEVDAIPASTLRQIVRDAIEQHVDPEALRLTRMVEGSERDGLHALAGRWLR